MIDDGIIKFDNSAFTPSGPLSADEYSLLENWRKKLFQFEMIGEYPIEKVGFGNMSQRKNYSSIQQTVRPQFVITGTQTGALPDLDGRHYTRILDYDFQQNKVIAQGPVNASSETLTHAAIYEINAGIDCIFHIHHREMWEAMLEQGLAKTPKEIPYGTLEMARAAQALFPGDLSGIFAMEGHQDGIIAFGASLDACGELLFDTYHKVLSA